MGSEGEYVTEADGSRVWREEPESEIPKRRRRSRANGPTRPVLSEQERAERAQFQRDRLEIRRREIAALEILAGPELRAKGERVQGERAIVLDARTAAGRELVRLERPTPGSSLRISARTYDGFKGGAPKFYALLSVFFRGSGGAPCRSKGIAVEGPELRKAGQALLALADEYDAACAAGVEPWAVAGGAWQPGEKPSTDSATADDDEPGDCEDCGGALPDGHLRGCPRTVDDELPPKSPAPVARSPEVRARPRSLLVRCADGNAEQIAATLREQGISAKTMDNLYLVFLGTHDEDEERALTERLAARGLRVERG